MPKYLHGDIYNIVRDIKHLQRDLRSLRLQIGSAGISLTSINVTGDSLSSPMPLTGDAGTDAGNPGSPSSPMIMRQTNSVTDAVLSDPALTDSQKNALVGLYDSFMRSNNE